MASLTDYGKIYGKENFYDLHLWTRETVRLLLHPHPGPPTPGAGGTAQVQISREYNVTIGIWFIIYVLYNGREVLLNEASFSLRSTPLDFFYIQVLSLHIRFCGLVSSLLLG